MVAYNFQRRFAEDMRSGRKRTTIRRPRKRQTKVGDHLKHYTEMRRKGCELLIEGVCKDVVPLRRVAKCKWEHCWEIGGLRGEARLSGIALELLAWLDGFESVGEFDKFFDRYETPTELELIRW